MRHADSGKAPDGDWGPETIAAQASSELVERHGPAVAEFFLGSRSFKICSESFCMCSGAEGSLTQYAVLATLCCTGGLA